MFTVHHQPQLALWLKEREKPKRLQALMEKERKSEFLRHAEAEGYLQSPSVDYLLERGRSKGGGGGSRRRQQPGGSAAEEESVGREQGKEEGRDNGGGAGSVTDIHLVKLAGVRLADLGQLQLLTGLRVCLLPGNYLTGFAALAHCPRLVRLDLHANQIAALPGPDFWRRLPELRVLHLHDNGLGRLEGLQALAGARSLQVLTLYDTPVSLRKTYRHHVVNSVWSLKALDFYVISDEEIIEDAVFGGRFAATHPAFRYNPMPPSKKDSTFEDEMALVAQILREVSHIQAHHSPVLLIQKVIRGFLVRRRNKLLFDTKIWASVCIQRSWRRYKGVEWAPPRPTGPPAPQRAPAKLQAEVLPASEPSSPLPLPAAALAPVAPSVTDGSTITRIDYDTYLANRRPGSKTPSIMSSAAAADRKPPDADEIRMTGYSEDKDAAFSMAAISSATPGVSEPLSSVRKRTNLRIDLTKLQTDSMFKSEEARRALVSETEAEEGGGGAAALLGLGLPRESSLEAGRSGKPRPQPAAAEGRRRKEFKTVKQMLGPLPSSQLERERRPEEAAAGSESDEDEPPVKFRLSGLKSVLHDVDLLHELLMERREAGEEIRTAHRQVIDKAVRKSRQRPTKASRSVNADQRLFARVQGTMGMSCLRAVQQAYRDRAKAERLETAGEKVSSHREHRQVSRQRAQGFLEEKRLQSVRQKDVDASDVAESLQKRADLERADRKKRRESHARSRQLSRDRAADRSFAGDFAGQNTSIANALLRHDRQAEGGGSRRGRQELVTGLRDRELRQLELVQRYLEHRQLMRQTQTAVERSALGTRMLQEANERLLEARARVAQQRQKAESVQAFYPLPKAAADPVLPPVNQEGKPDRYQTLIAMYEGRVGNHPTVIQT